MPVGFDKKITCLISSAISNDIIRPAMIKRNGISNSLKNSKDHVNFFTVPADGLAIQAHKHKIPALYS